MKSLPKTWFRGPAWSPYGSSRGQGHAAWCPLPQSKRLGPRTPCLHRGGHLLSAALGELSGQGRQGRGRVWMGWTCGSGACRSRARESGPRMGPGRVHSLLVQHEPACFLERRVQAGDAGPSSGAGSAAASGPSGSAFAQPRCFPFSLMRTSLMQSVRCVGPLSVRQGAGLPRAVAGTSSLLLLRPRRLWPGWGRLRPARAPPFAVALPAHLCELGKEPQLPLLPQTAVATGPARPAAPGLKTRRRARVRARALLGPSLPADTSKHSVVCVDTWHSKFHVGALLCTHWAF